MKTVLLTLIIVLVSVYIVFRPVMTSAHYTPDILKADPPSRESRPMSRPKDTWNNDLPMMMATVPMA